MRQIEDSGVDFVKQFEGCKLVTYKDLVGVLTIGYGHTGPDVHEGMMIDKAEAEHLLQSDLSRTASKVESLVETELNDNQFMALVSFAFNLGVGNLHNSTLLKKINEGDLAAASDEFLKWNHAGGQVVDGLTRRRTAERDLFNMG